MDLRTAVNPTYFTAKTTAFMLAGAKDRDALEFIGGMGLTRDSLIQNSEKAKEENAKPSPLSEEDTKAIFTGVTLSVEARYKGISRVLKEGNYKNYLDIACGYTPRSIYCEREGVNYVGMDVPVAAEELQAFAKKRFTDRKRPTYVGGDATNAASLKAAADLLEGEVMISSEGLIAYLSKDEIEQFVGGIRDVLKEHGGAWYTSDWGVDYEKFATFAMSSPEAAAVYNQSRLMTMKASGIFQPDLAWKEDEIIAFLNEHGLNVEKIPFYTDDEQVLTLFGYNGEGLEKAKALLKEATIWKMTPDESTSFSEKIEGAKEVANLKMYYTVNKKVLNMNLTGRVDTISGPALLEIIEAADSDITSLIINAANLEYISSAGLRVLLIGVKKIGEVKVINASEGVKDIFAVTGFDNMMQVE